MTDGGSINESVPVVDGFQVGAIVTRVGDPACAQGVVHTRRTDETFGGSSRLYGVSWPAYASGLPALSYTTWHRESELAYAP